VASFPRVLPVSTLTSLKQIFLSAERSVVSSMSVCLSISVGGCVCYRAYLRKHTSNTHFTSGDGRFQRSLRASKWIWRTASRQRMASKQGIKTSLCPDGRIATDKGYCSLRKDRACNPVTRTHFSLKMCVKTFISWRINTGNYSSLCTKKGANLCQSGSVRWVIALEVWFMICTHTYHS